MSTAAHVVGIAVGCFIVASGITLTALPLSRSVRCLGLVLIPLGFVLALATAQ